MGEKKEVRGRGGVERGTQDGWKRKGRGTWGGGGR